MKISRYSDSEPIKEAEGVSRRDVLTADDGASLFCMQVIEISPHISTPSHYHPWEHEVFILSGKGIVVGEHGSTPIAEGNVLFIPTNEPHCFVSTGTETLRFVCVEPLAK